MKKRTSMSYSMTKKQRKILSESDKKTQQPEVSEEKIEVEEQKEQKNTRKRSIASIAIIAMSVFLSLALIISAVTVYLVRWDRFIPEGNPIATIYLDNGMKLEFELFMDSAPIASTNFIFLSKIGFFDNTVIHDIQNQWVRFGGYEKGYSGYKDGKDSPHRAQNLEFVRKANKYFKKYNIDYFMNGIKEDGYDPFENEDQIFNYRLRKEKTASSTINPEDVEEGDLFFYYYNSSTMMQIAGADNIPFMVNSGDANVQTKNLNYSTRFGRANNKETLENLKQLKDLEVIAPGASSYWNRPKTEIIIDKIEISNVGRKVWRDILNKTGIDVHFESGIDPERDSYESGTAGHRRKLFIDETLH